MLARVASAAFAVALLAVATEARAPMEIRAPGYSFLSNSLHKRSLTGQTVAFACYGGGGDCECPTDNNGDSGVLINVFPGYQCAYPNGACTWDDKVSARTFELPSAFNADITLPPIDWCPSEHRADQLPVHPRVQHERWLQLPHGQQR